MKTGIVILNYNDYVTTKEIIERIRDYKTIDLVVIVDNNSTNDSYEILKKYESDKIAIINSGENKGYSYGNNIGCKYLAEKGMDYIIVSNPDIIFREEDITNLIKHFENPKIAVVSPTIIQGKEIIKGWKFPSVLVDSLGNLKFAGKYFKKILLYNKDCYLKEITKVDVISGCFFIIKKEVLEKINYFDENVFLYYEENILAKKIEKEGLDIIVDNKVEIIHNHSVTIDKIYNKIKKFKMLTKSQRYYHKKYNNANIIGDLWLKFTAGISIFINYILQLGEIWKRKK